MSTLELRIYIEQEKYIKEHFSEHAAEVANYGWGVDEMKDGISVSTKVYGHGILCSVAHLGDKEITHSFEDFDDENSTYGQLTKMSMEE
ncbi:hypothetical protein MUP59_06820 [Candidatus Bathyarchaeota archaeon]|nr:hypothetical protein [Candidatus Bathyarchaeota archaeon]